MADDILQSTAQNFLDIYDITNNLLICKDGSTSILLAVDAMNFGLLAEEEQDAIMYAYAGLLNSLNYPIQIVVRSQTKDVTSYLKLLEEQELSATSEIIKKRIRIYREFVGNLIHERNVLDKKFYVVIPASPLELGLLAVSSVIPGKQTFDVASVEKSVLLEKALTILEPKRDHLISQFARIGLFSRQLNTQEIIQLFYLSYNPEASEGQNIDDSSSYTTPLVQPDVIQDLRQVNLPPITQKTTQAVQSMSQTSAATFNTQAQQAPLAPVQTIQPGITETSYQAQPSVAQEIAPISSSPSLSQTQPMSMDAASIDTTQPTQPVITQTISTLPPAETSPYSTYSPDAAINIPETPTLETPAPVASAQDTVIEPSKEPQTIDLQQGTLPPLPEIT